MTQIVSVRGHNRNSHAFNMSQLKLSADKDVRFRQFKCWIFGVDRIVIVEPGGREVPVTPVWLMAVFRDALDTHMAWLAHNIVAHYLKPETAAAIR